MLLLGQTGYLPQGPALRAVERFQPKESSLLVLDGTAQPLLRGVAIGLLLGLLSQKPESLESQSGHSCWNARKAVSYRLGIKAHTTHPCLPILLARRCGPKSDTIKLTLGISSQL